MKKAFLFVIVMFGLSKGFSQGKATLTKGETVNYIQKKLNEAFNHKNGLGYALLESSVSLTDCSIKYDQHFKNKYDKPSSSIVYSDTDYEEFFEHTVFNLTQITKIEDKSTAGGTLGKMRIYFVGKTAVNKFESKSYNQKKTVKRVQTGRDYYGNPVWGNQTEYYYEFESNGLETETLDYRDIYFLKADPTNYDKLRKAFEHLRDLCKAEDDPFGK
ncbi:MAG: hypothetical protein ACK4S0_05525 [Sediminibacterium sp.]